MTWRNLLLVLSLIAGVYEFKLNAFTCLPHNKTYLTCKEVDIVEGTGGLYLDRTSVLYWINAIGCVSADCSKLGAVSVSGSVYLHNSNVHGDFCVCGKAKLCKTTVEGNVCMRGILEAYDSKFDKPIQIASTYIELNNTEACAIIVQDNGCSPCDLQVLKLNRGSVINGGIVFQSGRGRILMDRTSSIHGTVQGGVITYPGDCGCY